jgi:hypothetical protein
MLEVERAQRAVLKVMLKKPRLYPTARLFSECKLLTVRQLYIMKAITRTHKYLLNSSIYEELLSKRIFKAPLPALKSTMARRCPAYSHPTIYNKICNKQNITKLSLAKAKRVVNNWLLTISYSDTENLV